MYDTAAFLAESQGREALCCGFLEHVPAALGAQAAALRFIGSDPPQLHLVASHNLPPGFAADTRCVAQRTCACAQAASGGSTIHRSVAHSAAAPLANCRKHGLMAMSALPLRTQAGTIGVLNLFYRVPHELAARERHLLETPGQHPGMAIENLRLVSRGKEMAVSKERNLLAQELHDSIAQSLAFLNLQVQMLGGALKREDRGAAGQATAKIATGCANAMPTCANCCAHFRTRSGHEDTGVALRKTLKKFEQESGIHTTFLQSGQAMPVPVAPAGRAARLPAFDCCAPTVCRQ